MKKQKNSTRQIAKISGLFKYIGPGLLVTVGFIDPGNWAANVAAGSHYGYSLLWAISIATVLLILLQHNAAHLGIATGYCLSEAATLYLKPWLSKGILISALVASISTALAEILGGAIALNMLFKLPLEIGALLVAGFVLFLLLTNSYGKLEKIIIGFVSLIGLSFAIEMFLVKVDWGSALSGWFTPSIKLNSMPVIMSLIGAVVMPHNLFLHSEIIQSRKWNIEDETIIKKQLRYEFTDTIFSMGVGWVINSSIIIVAAAGFFSRGIIVTELPQAQQLLTPIAGAAASLIFALALLFAGVASSVTAGIAGGSIFAGMGGEAFDIKKRRSRIGVISILVAAAIVILFIRDPFNSLIYSQVLLSVQLPITVFLQIYLTSSSKVMGRYKNTLMDKIALYFVAVVVSGLNILLFASFL